MDDEELFDALLARSRRGDERETGSDIAAASTAAPTAISVGWRRRVRLAFALLAVGIVASAVAAVASRRDGAGTGPLATTASVVATSTTPTRPGAAPLSALDLDAADSEHAWLTTNRGLLATHDGGKVWQTLATYSVNWDDMRPASFALASDRSGLLVVSDAGVVRATQFTPSRRVASRIVVKPGDGADGLALTYQAGQYWLEVDDGCGAGSCWSRLLVSRTGADWSQRYSGRAVTGVKCSRPTTCWGSRQGSRDADGAPLPEIVRTLDGGRTWTEILVPFPRFNSGLGGTAEVVVARDQLFIIRVDVPSGMEGQTYFLVSTDGGRTFVSRRWSSTKMHTGPQLQVVPIDGDRWNATWDRWSYSTTNSGRTWIRKGTTGPLLDPVVAWPQPANGWIAGSLNEAGNGSRFVVMRTDDAGAHWRDVTNLG